MKKAAFFDRDGTINEDIGYLYKIKDLKIREGIPGLIKLYNELGWLVIVVTNQSGIARGYYSKEQMESLNREINHQLKKIAKAHIDAFYYCPHLPCITGECNCRKPKPGLFLKAAREWDINLSESVSYGDSIRDKAASLAAGIHKYFYIV